VRPKIKKIVGIGFLTLVALGIFIYAVLNSSDFNPQSSKPLTIADVQKQETESQVAVSEEQNKSTAKSDDHEPQLSNETSTPLPKTGPSSPTIIFLSTGVFSFLIYEFVIYRKRPN
jgi:cytoskeletal protein RodZ